MSLGLSALRDALEGGAPAVIATSALDGTPNVSYVSDVHYVDERHLALSWQFFSKTRRNVLENPFARVLVTHARTAARWRLLVQYLRTETAGPLFERMRARLAGIASEQGMQDVFVLRGADVYRVIAIDPIAAPVLPVPARPSRLAALRRLSAALVAATTPEALIDELLGGLEREFAISHSQLLLREQGADHLVLLAAQGYATAPAGAEAAFGEGVVGVAAEVGCPIRINHALAKRAYLGAVRRRAEDEGLLRGRLPTPPGLEQPGSQMAVPMRLDGLVHSVLYVEDALPGRFDEDLEDALAVIADLWSRCARQLDVQDAAATAPSPPSRAPAAASSAPRRVSRQRRTAAVFIDGQYVIRGLAGAILWKLLQAWCEGGRTRFSSRELRADGSLNLPEIADNLSARLILLQRRLAELDLGIVLSRSGRGLYDLCVQHPIVLAEPASDG